MMNNGQWFQNEDESEEVIARLEAFLNEVNPGVVEELQAKTMMELPAILPANKQKLIQAWELPAENPNNLNFDKIDFGEVSVNKRNK